MRKYYSSIKKMTKAACIILITNNAGGLYYQIKLNKIIKIVSAYHDLLYTHISCGRYQHTDKTSDIIKILLEEYRQRYRKICEAMSKVSQWNASRQLSEMLA